MDKVFLLSYAEAKKYCYGEDIMAAKGTDYVLKKVAISADKNTIWWLRSPGPSLAAVATGQMHLGGGWQEYSFANYDSATVRPAVWVDINAFS